MTLYDESSIEIFSTSPQSKDLPRETYVQQVIDVARWSRRGRLVPPYWSTRTILSSTLGVVSQIILQNTEKLWPLDCDSTGLYAPRTRPLSESPALATFTDVAFT